jgi:hypothetical protein
VQDWSGQAIGGRANALRMAGDFDVRKREMKVPYLKLHSLPGDDKGEKIMTMGKSELGIV